jgi:tape measure domain-containing protein
VASTIGSKISGGFRSTVSAAANAAKNGASAMASGFSGVGSKIGSVLSRGFSGIPSLAGKTGNQAGQAMTSNLMSHLGRIPAMVGSLVGVAGIGGILSAGFKRMNDIDHANIIFKNIGLSSKDAKTQMSKLNDQVTGTSTSLSTAAKVSGLLAQSGVEMGDGMDTSIKALTNLSAASGASADDIGMVMLQMKSSGHLYTQDLLQMTQRGINAFGMLADSMGISQEEVRKQVSDGKLTYEDFVKAVNQGTGELAKEMGTTLPAKLTILKTAFANLGMQAIEPFKKQIGQALDAVTQFLKTVVTPKVKEFATWMTGNSESAKQFRETMMLAGAAIVGVTSALAGLWVAAKFIEGLKLIGTMISSPFLIAVAVIGVLIGAVIVAYTKFEWFRDVVEHVWTRLKLFFFMLVDGWKDADESISASGVPGFFQGLGKLAHNVFDGIVDAVKLVAGELWDRLGPMVEKAGGWFHDAFKDAGKVLGGIGDAISGVVDWLGKTKDKWGPFAQGIALVAAALVGYNIVAGIAAGISSVLAGALAIITSPITLIIVGIGLLVGSLIWAYENIGWFHDFVDGFWAGMKDLAGKFATWWTETFWPGVMAVFGWLGSAFQAIGQFAAGAWAWIVEATTGFLTWWTETFWPGISNPLTLLGQAFQWFNDAIIQPVWSWIKTTIGGFFDWWSGIFWPGLQTTITLLGIAFTWFRDNIVTPVWTAISNVISWAWHSIIQPIWNGIVWFINSILIPGFQWLGTFISNIWNWISNIISWAWNVVVKPIWNAIIAFINGILIPGFQWLGQFISNIWNWIVSVISWAWNNMIKPIWTALKWFIDYILIPGFQWLGQFISNIWNWIVQIISWAWNVAIKPIWDAIKWFIDNILIPAFQWLGTKIKMIWDWIGNIIGSTWTWLRDSIFNPMMNFIQNNLVQAWDNTANLIRDAWDKLRDAVKKPIKFVVDKVVNPFVGAYNTVKKAWGGKDIDELKPKGWATGGYTGPGGKYDPAGIVHADEYVIKKSSRKKFEQRYPGYLDAINSTGDLPDSPKNAYAKGGNGIAAGTVPPHGPGTNVWGSMQAEASKAGKMVFKATNISGVDTESAAKAWMGRSALDVKMGNGGPGVSSFVNGNSGGWGYYSGNQIQVSSAVPANRVRGVLVHEMGHALGLDHVGMGDSSSVMDHMMTGGDWPHSGDYQALRELWGEPGKGVKTYENPGGGGGSGSSWIVEAVRKIVDSVFNKGRDLARGKFKGNDFVEDGIGVGQTSVDGIIDWLSQLFGGGGSNDSGGESSKPAEQWRSTVIEALKRVGLPTSNDYVNAWIRQIASESGGNPNAVQGNIGDINNATGDIAKGLVQVIGSTFAAYRDPSLPNDRFNPLASLVAGMRYAKATYGISGMLGAIGHGHGYSEGGRVKKATLFDGGGKLDKGIQFIDHQRDKPDYVLTHEQWRAMYSIAENSASKSQGMVINGGIHGYSAEEVGREVEKQRKRREALYA